MSRLHPATALRARTVIDRTARAFGTTGRVLIAPGRTLPIARARFAAVWMVHAVLAFDWSAIGRCLGRRHHTTIIHAHRRAEQLRAHDVVFRRLTDRLLAEINGNHRG